jgi:uncharacterized protein (DUF427 family)
MEVVMRASPGHRKWPDHLLQEEPIAQRMKVAVDGEVIADSDDVVKVYEADSPVRYYFPRRHVKMDRLARSSTTTECPFKGTAKYFHIHAGGTKLQDAVWTYEEPYAEHVGLRNRVAFYDDRVPDIEVSPA